MCYGGNLIKHQKIERSVDVVSMKLVGETREIKRIIKILKRYRGFSLNNQSEIKDCEGTDRDKRFYADIMLQPVKKPVSKSEERKKWLLY